MEAIRAHTSGAPDVLLLEELPDPRPRAGQILIRVDSAAVNYADLIRRRAGFYPFPTTFPYTPGSEVAGTVAALGEGVEGPPVGTPVFALVGDDGSTGYAQFAVAAAPQVIPIPPGLTPDQAAALGVAGTSAMLMLTETARLQPGESVLVPAAGGGVGSYAVQIARLLGAGTVIGAAGSPARRAAALSLGAGHVVDYRQDDWPERVRELTDGRGVDVVLEMSGGRVAAQSLGCLAPFGRFVVYGMASGEPLELDADATRKMLYDPSPNGSLHAFNLGLYFGLRPEAAVRALQELIGHVVAGRLTVQVGHVLPLAQAADAHRLIEERRSTGKVILKPWA